MEIDWRAELAEMAALDRDARTALWRTLKEQGQQSEAHADAQATAARTFAANAERLSALVEAHGWPPVAAVGEEASRAAFFVLQHAEVGIQKRFLPVVRAATERGEIEASLLPLLEDRILMHDGEEQTYGTQLHHDENGEPALWPIRDVRHVDERRASVGLPPLREYLEKAGLAHLDPLSG